MKTRALIGCESLEPHIGFSYAQRAVPSILAEVTCFNFLHTGTPEVGFLGSDGYRGKVGLIARCLVVNLDEWYPEGKSFILKYNYMALT